MNFYVLLIYLPTKGIGNIVKCATTEFIRNRNIDKILNENKF